MDDLYRITKFCFSGMEPMHCHSCGKKIGFMNALDGTDDPYCEECVNTAAKEHPAWLKLLREETRHEIK